jgi:hypothetical protein
LAIRSRTAAEEILLPQFPKGVVREPLVKLRRVQALKRGLTVKPVNDHDVLGRELIEQ